MAGVSIKPAVFAAIVFGAVAAIAVAGIIHRGGTGFSSPLAAAQHSHGAPNEELLALLSRASSTGQIAARSRSSDCSASGALPDPACTPGSVFASVGAREICISGYSSSVRNVPVSLKRRIYQEYGLSYPQAAGAYEADHLIPLELGGSNDIANLWPEAALPSPGYREKDLVENYLHDEVCAGAIDLAAAQKQIARDWLAVYETLTPEELAALSAEAKSFSN